jgi:hypothetical protein
MAALALGAASVAVGGRAPTDSPATVQCPEYRSLQLEVGVWTRAKLLRREFFVAAWSRGASRAGGIIVFGWGTPATFSTDSQCNRLRRQGSTSSAKLRMPLVYRRARAGAGYFVDRNGRTQTGYPLHLRSFGWYFADRTLHDTGLDLVSRRKGHGLRYDCGRTGRVVIHVHRVKDRSGRETGSYFSVRPQNSRRLVATALLNADGDSWFRISRRCVRVPG